MICPKCGKYNSNDTKICENCGYSFIQPLQEPLFRDTATSNGNQQSTVSTESPKSDKTGTKSYIAVGVIVAVLIVGTLITFAINNCSDNLADTTITAATENTTAATTLPTMAGTEKPTEPPTEAPTEAPTEPPTEKPTEPPTEAQNIYPESTYKIGQDMPAGEYVIFASSEFGGYYSVNSDSRGEIDSIIGNDNFDYCAIVTVLDGQYLELKRAYAVPASEAKIDTSGDGTFRVGYEITAGEFKLQATSEYGGYYAVYDSSYPDAEIVTNDNFDGTTYITVSDGQYLLLTRCKIVQ